MSTKKTTKNIGIHVTYAMLWVILPTCNKQLVSYSPWSLAFIRCTYSTSLRISERWEFTNNQLYVLLHFSNLPYHLRWFESVPHCLFLHWVHRCSVPLPQSPFWWLLVVAVTNSLKHSFNHCKSVTYKFLSRDTKSARDKNGTKPRKNKVKNTSPEISLVEYLCFVCKGTNLSLEKRGEIPISLIHNSFSYHCTLNVVIASDFDLKQHDLRKSGVKFCFALCWTFSKTRTGGKSSVSCPLKPSDSAPLC